MEDTIENYLNRTPCIFCQYDGPSFYRKGAHMEHCPWYEIGGAYDRIEYFKKCLLNGKIKIIHKN